MQINMTVSSDFACLSFWKILKIDLISQEYLVYSEPLSEFLEWASWNLYGQNSISFVF